jgi:tRNA dimethylallyltransferase
MLNGKDSEGLDLIKSPKLLVVIVGPTAVGKTALAVQVARHFRTEIISADSRQFFREMNIGTAKPGQEERNQVVHHFIDTLSVSDEYDAGKFEQEANTLISKLFIKHQVVILSGGSGMYIDAVCKGFDDLPEVRTGVREQVNSLFDTIGIRALQEQLLLLDPAYYQLADRDNPKRLSRALEICISSGKPYSSFLKGENKKKDFSILKIGLTMDRRLLYNRINERVDGMMDAGLLEEVTGLLPYRKLNALQTVGYKELFDYQDKLHSLDRAIELIKQNSRRFAKRQLTWFRKDPDTKWFEPDDYLKITAYIDTHI